MNKTLVLIILYLTLPFQITAFYELNELSLVLNQLSNLKPSESQELTEEFYRQLEQTIYESKSKNILGTWEGKYNPELLDTLGSNDTVKTTKFMMKIAPLWGRYYVGADEIITLIRIYNSIIKNYDKSIELIIVSVASGYLEKEYVLLRTLVENGFNKIKFYGIDPSEATKNKLEQFKEDSIFQGIKFGYFEASSSYMNEKIKKENEIPNICMIFGPYGDIGKQAINFMKRKESAILAIPEILDELSILASKYEIIGYLNEKLAIINFPTKKYIVNLFGDIPFSLNGFGIHSVILDFLEIIKLASLPKKDCIAYLQCGSKVVQYKDIATKSLAKLYSEFQGSYDEQRIKCPCTAYIYNPVTQQFEKENLVHFSDEYKDLVSEYLKRMRQ